MEMVEWFLLDGVDGQRTGFAIDLADKHTVVVSATTTAACPSVGDTAVVRTEQTLHHPIVQPLIIPTLTIHCSLFTVHYSLFVIH